MKKSLATPAKQDLGISIDCEQSLSFPTNYTLLVIANLHNIN